MFDTCERTLAYFISVLDFIMRRGISSRTYEFEINEIWEFVGKLMISQPLPTPPYWIGGIQPRSNPQPGLGVEEGLQNGLRVASDPQPLTPPDLGLRTMLATWQTTFPRPGSKTLANPLCRHIWPSACKAYTRCKFTQSYTHRYPVKLFFRIMWDYVLKLRWY